MYAATSSLTAWRISAAIGPPCSRRAPPRGTALSGSSGQRIPALAVADRRVGRSGLLLDAVEQAHDPSGRLAFPRLVPDGRQVDEHVRRRATCRGLPEERGNVEVAGGVGVASPDQGFRRCD